MIPFGRDDAQTPTVGEQGDIGIHPNRWRDRGRLYRLDESAPKRLVAGTLNGMIDMVSLFPDRWAPYLIAMDDGEQIGWQEIANLAMDPARPVVGPDRP